MEPSAERLVKPPQVPTEVPAPLVTLEGSAVAQGSHKYIPFGLGCGT